MVVDVVEAVAIYKAKDGLFHTLAELTSTPSQEV
jgi:hypothetical protein